MSIEVELDGYKVKFDTIRDDISPEAYARMAAFTIELDKLDQKLKRLRIRRDFLRDEIKRLQSEDDPNEAKLREYREELQEIESELKIGDLEKEILDLKAKLAMLSSL